MWAAEAELEWEQKTPAQHPQPVVGDSLEQELPKPVLPFSCLKSKPGIEIFFFLKKSDQEFIPKF